MLGKIGNIFKRNLKAEASRCFHEVVLILPQVKCPTVPSNAEPLGKHRNGEVSVQPNLQLQFGRDYDIKLQMNKKFCNKCLGPKLARQPRKSMTLKELQCKIVENFMGSALIPIQLG